jgi:hypothetical protein
MQLEVEMGNDPAKHDQDMMNAVHWTMRYIVKDGNDMSGEMIDVAMGVCSGVTQNSTGVPRVSAMHMMSIMLTHTGQHTFAAAYQKMVAEEVEKSEFIEQQGIEYA